MMRSLFSGVAGLKNHQTRMDVTGNNIANVNTVGYKAGRTTFQDMLSQSIKGAASPTGTTGGVNPLQVGLGMSVASVDNIFTTGSLQNTGKNTDLAIDGDGFFMVKSGNQVYYTRAGNFDFDSMGNYVVPGTGLQVMGWPADSSGNINNSTEPTGLTIPLNDVMPPKVSTLLSFEKNLTGTANTVGSTHPGRLDIYDSLGTAHRVDTNFVKVGDTTWLAVTKIADGTLSNPVEAYQELKFNSDGKLVSTNQLSGVPTATTSLEIGNLQLDNTLNSTHSQNFVVFDNSGNPRVFTLTAKCTAVANAAAVPPVDDTWSYTITEASAATTSTVASGTITWGAGAYNGFPTSFSFDNPTQTVSLTLPAIPTAPAAGLFDAAPTGANGVPGSYPYITGGAAQPISFQPAGGANPLQLTLDFSKVTQYAAKTSDLVAMSTDGYGAGTLNRATLTVDSTGVIFGQFSNGQLMNLGQVATALFTNPAGLTKVGTSLYSRSNNSGVPQWGIPGQGSYGSIMPSTLEMSNVDLSEEFTTMITTQRGFQANSRIITTSDTMLEELVNLKR